VSNGFQSQDIGKGGENVYKMYEKARDEKSLTDYEVAKQTGLSRSTLSEWKSGLHTPSLETLKKLADFFGKTVDYFIQDSA